MKSKQKRLALILAAAMLFCTVLTACSGGGSVTPNPTPAPGGTEPDYTVDKENQKITATDGSWVIELTEDESGNEVVVKTNNVSLTNQNYAVTSDSITTDETDGTITIVRKIAVPRSALEELEPLTNALVMMALGDAEMVEVTFTFTYTSEGTLVSVKVEYEECALEYNDAFELVEGDAGDLSSVWEVILQNAVTEDAVKEFIEAQNIDAYKSGRNILALSKELKNESVVVGSGYCGAEGNEENVTWTLDENGTLVISGSGKMADIYIDPWDENSIRSVIVKQGVTNVGTTAFRDCRNLRSATIAGSVTEIGFSAFSGCSDLTSVTLSQGVKSIGMTAFSGCKNLREIIFPDSIEGIEAGAFADRDSLMEIILPNGISSIEAVTFSGCDGLTKVSIPEGVTNIDSQAFANCTSLTSVVIPASVTRLAADAFGGCTKMDKVNVEEGNAFYSDENGILLNKSGTTLIWYPEGRTEYVIPDSVVEIDTFAFAGNQNLTSIVIPGRVSSILDGAFYGCVNLEHVTIEEGVTSIGNGAFTLCTGLKEVELPSSLTEIEQGTFIMCESLTSIVVPEGVRIIGIHAFEGCSSLQCAYLPKSLVVIANGAFENTALSEIFYAGSQSEWSAVQVSDAFTNVEVHCNATF